MQGLLELMGPESAGSLRKLGGMAALSGLANALVLAVVNGAAAAVDAPVQQVRYLLLFAIVFVAYILAQYYILVQSTGLVETVLNQIRLRVIDRIRTADLLPLEAIGRSSIYSMISKELVAVSQATTTCVTACQSALLILFSLLYLVILSRAAFWITISITLLGVSIHFEKRREMQQGVQESNRRENAFLDLFTQMLDGFKEMKLNRRLADDLTGHVRQGSDAVARANIDLARRFGGHAVFSQAAFYVMIAAIVFLLPKFEQTNPEVLTKATATILFIVGPLSLLIGSIPVMAQANVAVANIRQLETTLASAFELPGIPSAPPAARSGFSSLQLEQLRFEYSDSSGQTAFAVGPVDLRIEAGETIFLVGGNGSGKSTLLRLLTSLYYPRGGRILMDGSPVTASNLDEYRSLFSVIFADYHLFDQLYGQSEIDPARIDRLIERFELTGKVGLDGQRWTSTALSTGQRKRLALIVSWLDDKPIHVFDEWAADQDPGFRRYFYETLLPEMKRRGKTVIAATHDDRYFHLADRVLRMEYGQLSQEGPHSR